MEIIFESGQVNRRFRLKFL